MKVASIIFIVIGMVINFLYSYAMGAVGVAVGIWMLATLNSNKKSIAAGVCGILFTGLLGGIFYLCWNPEVKKDND